MDAYGKVESISEVDGPVHWIYRTVSDVEQGGCVVKAQVPRNGEHKYTTSYKSYRSYTSSKYMLVNPYPSKTSAW